MVHRDDRDILLPPSRDPWRLLRDLRAWLPRRRSESTPCQSAPQDLRLAFEYLAAECAAKAQLLEDLAQVLAANMAALSGQARFDVQCCLSEALTHTHSPRFYLALHLATSLPVPQARGSLLRMLTEASLAHWSFPVADESPLSPETFDLRPVVVAALGQLQDPSLLGLFHRLLEKLAQLPTTDPIFTAVHWSLMNLAPGNRSEPVPFAMLTRRRADAIVLPASHAAIGHQRAPVQQAAGNKAAGNGQKPAVPSSGRSERRDLLADF